MKIRNKTPQDNSPEITEQFVLLKTETVGNNKLEVYVEECEDKTFDFFFTINGKFFDTTKSYTIQELYKIYCVVQETLIDYIENTVLTSLPEKGKIELYIGACGNSNEEVSTKQQVYSRQIGKLTKKYKNITDLKMDEFGDYVITFKSV